MICRGGLSLGFDFQKFLLIYAPGAVSQSFYFASKETWEKYQNLKLKTVSTQNGLFYFIKFLVNLAIFGHTACTLVNIDHLSVQRINQEHQQRIYI